MINLEQNVLCGETWGNLSCGEVFPNKLTFFLAKSVLSQFTLFCREIYFVAISALLCGEKLNQKLCLWRKKDKYHVCILQLSSIQGDARHVSPASGRSFWPYLVSSIRSSLHTHAPIPLSPSFIAVQILFCCFRNILV